MSPHAFELIPTSGMCFGIPRSTGFYPSSEFSNLALGTSRCNKVFAILLLQHLGSFYASRVLEIFYSGFKHSGVPAFRRSWFQYLPLFCKRLLSLIRFISGSFY